MKIGVITTGGFNIGYGHFMRSISFTLNAPQYAQVILYPIVDTEDIHLFTGLGSKVDISRSENEIIEKLKKYKPDIIVWDTIDCSLNLLEALKSISSRHVSISPVFRHMKEMDILFNRNANAIDIEGVVTYKGLEYAIFSDNCQYIDDDIYYKNLGKKYLTIGISMGGSDAPNKTLKILNAIADLPIPLTIWVLIGEGYAHSYEELVKTIRRHVDHEVILAKTNRSLWDVVSNCNIAILAGGLMLIEAIYAGLPSINIFEKEEHQQTTGNYLIEKGAAYSVGVISNDAIEKLKLLLMEINSQKSLLLQMRENTKGLIDKLAVSRIFEIISK